MQGVCDPLMKLKRGERGELRNLTVDIVKKLNDVIKRQKSTWEVSESCEKFSLEFEKYINSIHSLKLTKQTY